MIKKCAIACSAIFFLSFHASAQTYLNCDFSQGIPADFTLIDNDGNTPSATMQKEGFSVGTPWIAASPKGESNVAACSTSWYSPKGTSDDWLITPSFRIDDANRNANYALAYAILENNVHKPGDSKYSQHNAYKNGESGVMGGYEKYGEYIPSEVMYYQCVARGFVDDINGIAGSVPTSYKADEPLVYDKSFALPDNILDDRNTTLVVMLIDRNDNHIVNAQIAPLGSNETTGIKPLIDNSQRHSLSTEYYNASGMRINAPQKGLNIIRTSDGRTVKVIRQ